MPAAANLSNLKMAPAEAAPGPSPGTPELFAALVAAIGAAPEGGSPDIGAAGPEAEAGNSTEARGTDGEGAADAAVLLPMLDQQRAAAPAAMVLPASTAAVGQILPGEPDMPPASAVAVAPHARAVVSKQIGRDTRGGHRGAGAAEPVQSGTEAVGSGGQVTTSRPAIAATGALAPAQARMGAVAAPSATHAAPASADVSTAPTAPSEASTAVPTVVRMQVAGAHGRGRAVSSPPVPGVSENARAPASAVAADAPARRGDTPPASPPAGAAIVTGVPVRPVLAQPHIGAPAASQQAIQGAFSDDKVAPNSPAASGATGQPVAAGQRDRAIAPSAAPAAAPAAPAAPAELGEQRPLGEGPGVQSVRESNAAAPIPATAPAGATMTPMAAAPAQNLGAAIAAQVLDLAKGGEWINEIARDLARSASADGAMRFRLAPETLGELRVEITHSERGAHVKLQVTSEAAQQALAEAQPKLVQEARAQGVRIAEAEVSLAGGQSQGREGGRHGPSEQPMRTFRSANDHHGAARDRTEPAHRGRTDLYA